MRYDKDEYEKLIASSRLFSLDKEKEHTAYRREALKMVEYLYCYLLGVNTSKYEPYGKEIAETAKRCIENYDPDTGCFLNYFSSAWKQTYGHLIGKELVRETFKGIHLTEEMERTLKKYIRLAQSMGVNTESSEFDERVAEAMEISVIEAANIRNMIRSKPTSDSGVNEEGEEYSLIDQIDSGNYTDAGMIQYEAAMEFLELLEITFDQLQDRQKPMLAMLITSKLAMAVNENEKLLEVIKGKSFFDEEIFAESLRRGEQIRAKEIAERFGVVEASASRTWKSFRKKIKLENRRY